ncbi:hypothetical protein [Puia sp.]|jgi:hypothetical protein|uniref:hypothetical protein n=1 Tax=Puia sp. TaxID=2045100 RepID=UPI002F41994D
MIASLEHEILGVLYTHPLVSVTMTGSDAAGHVPIFARQYATAHLDFGVLVDILNNPGKYDKPIPGVKFVNQHRVKFEEVNTARHAWWEVSDALEVLVANGHVVDLQEGNWQETHTRTIQLTKPGAIIYRKQTYLKEAEEEEIRGLKGRLSRIEYRQKRLGLLYDGAKVLLGAVIGALVTYLVAKAKS